MSQWPNTVKASLKKTGNGRPENNAHHNVLSVGEGRPLAVVFDPQGKLHYKASNLPTGEHIVAVLGSHVTRAYQKNWKTSAFFLHYENSGQQTRRNKGALKHLEDFGAKEYAS